MLIFGFFSLFVACIAYSHADFSISKSSTSYLAKLQWDEVSLYCSTCMEYLFKVNLFIHACYNWSRVFTLCILGANYNPTAREYYQSMFDNP